MRMKVSAARPLSGVVLVGLLAGCKTWQPATMSAEAVLGQERPASVRVTTSEGRAVTLKNPIIVNDSIVSSVAPRPGVVVPPPRLGVPSQDVRSLEVARFSAGKTIALVAVITAASVGWAAVAGAHGGGSLPPDPKDPKTFAPQGWRGLQLVWRVFGG